MSTCQSLRAQKGASEQRLPSVGGGLLCGGNGPWRLNPDLLHWQTILYHSATWEAPHPGFLEPRSVLLSTLAHCFPTAKELFWSRGKESLQNTSQGHQVLGRAKVRQSSVSFLCSAVEVHFQNKPTATCSSAAQRVRLHMRQTSHGARAFSFEEKNEDKPLRFLKVWALTTA